MERIEKEHKDKIMEIIRKAGDPENYETSWDNNGTIHKIKEKSRIKKGSLSRAQGGRFELKVRKDLEGKGWIVSKWVNNVEFKEENK
ncbi:Uncharacterised protein [uncultured archaeon]|nr:Uncharacterised protein [uncultured archaeon]